MTSIKCKLAGFAVFIILTLPGFCCHAQNPCILVKAEFSDASASESQKTATVDILKKRVKSQGKEAEITLENGSMVAKIPYGGDEHRQQFHPDRFAIYETFEATELETAIDGIVRISESHNLGNFSRILDTNFAIGACVGSCPIGLMEQFSAIVSRPECRKLLPEDLSFCFGTPVKGANAVSVYAVKKTDKPPVTIGMMKEAWTARSFDHTHYDVLLEFKKEYRTIWEEFTRKNTGKCLAIMLGNTVLSCPMLMSPIANGKATVGGRMDRAEAEVMAQRINLSLPLEILITEVKML